MPARYLSQLGLKASTPPRATAEVEGGHGYPRPQLRREGWISLNGPWEFAIDASGALRSPGEVTFDQTIEVPFSPETPRSGVHDTGLYKACWYRRSLELAPPGPCERCVLHFGAVDYQATVWVDGCFVCAHEGGYTPFSVDVTPFLRPGAEHEIVVRAEDDPSDLAKPRGKQDWRLDPHSIWYPRTTGIWQTVWLERVPSTHVAYLRWGSNLERWEIDLEAHICAPADERVKLAVTLRTNDLILARDEYAVVAGEVHRRIALSDPGIDDFRNELLWSPRTPTLIHAEIDLFAANGEKLDSVSSYTALRSFELQGDRFVLNGLPFPLRMVLDQGYWLDTGLTPPDDGALRRDVELAKAMGFNGVRKHQKIEDPRYLYWADRLGLLVWEEMPSAYRFTTRSVERLMRQWLDVLRRDISHPCVVTWVPFNESWGVPNLPSSHAERHFVSALYHVTKTFDPTRPVVGNDGWESIATDVVGIHDYDSDPDRLGRRYLTPDVLPRVLKRERPGGRRLVLEGDPATERPVVLSEFGGIALRREGAWGYSECSTPADLARRLRELLATVNAIELFAGYCYTQFADTYQEANGLLYADRTPKVPIATIAAAVAVRGAPPEPPLDPPPIDPPLIPPVTGRGGAPE